MKLENVDKLKPEGVSIGILMPMLANRFVIGFKFPSLRQEAADAIVRECISVKTDFLNKTVKLEIQQSIMASMSEAIDDMIDASKRHSCTLAVLFMNGDNTSSSRLEFENVKCTEHSLNFDYAESGASTHLITMSYKTLSAVHE